MKFLLIFVTPLFFFPAASTVLSPHVSPEYGPLYEGVENLIMLESFDAELDWSDMLIDIIECTERLQNTLEEIQRYSALVDELLENWTNVDPVSGIHRCYKQNERQIAHFNRDFYGAYSVCKRSLDAGIAHVQNETLEELHFLGNASLQIENVKNTCNTTMLRHNNTNQEGVVMCVISQIGAINLRFFQSSQICSDIAAEVSMLYQEGSDSDCGGFKKLKAEFDVVFGKITQCIRDSR